MAIPNSWIVDSLEAMLNLPYAQINDLCHRLDTNEKFTLMGYPATTFDNWELVAPQISGNEYPFNVLLFGAKGDGVTDDSAAIQAAINAAASVGYPPEELGGIVYFPTTVAANGYLVKSTLVIPEGTGLLLLGDSAASIHFSGVSVGISIPNSATYYFGIENLSLFGQSGTTLISANQALSMSLTDCYFGGANEGDIAPVIGLQVTGAVITLDIKNCSFDVDQALVLGTPSDPIQIDEVHFSDCLIDFTGNTQVPTVLDYCSSGDLTNCSFTNCLFEGPFEATALPAMFRIGGGSGNGFLFTNCEFADMNSTNPLFIGLSGFAKPIGMTFVSCALSNTAGPIFDWSAGTGNPSHHQFIGCGNIQVGADFTVWANSESLPFGLILIDTGLTPNQQLGEHTIQIASVNSDETVGIRYLALAGTTTPPLQIETSSGGLLFSIDPNGRILMPKDTSAITAPGADQAFLRWEAGTNAGTLKLVAYAGTSTTGVTVVDNVGTGN